jgi:hypothetical protein
MSLSSCLDNETQDHRLRRQQSAPPTQAFAQQRGSGCGTLLVALLVLGIITAIVIFLGAFGLLDWIFS